MSLSQHSQVKTTTTTTAATTTESKTSLSTVATGKKVFTRRDRLSKIETTIRSEWEKLKIFEANPDESRPKYLITFPYPYMNGRLHLGHAFSLSKSEFAARFHRLLGENVLFPFAFHCTGMPISAASDKLKREIKLFGNPPVFPTTSSNSTSEVTSLKEGEEVEKSDNISELDSKTKKDIVNSSTTTATAATKEKDVTKFTSNKSKATAKAGNVVYQWNIMKGMGITDDQEIARFSDEKYWLSYFPPLAKQDLIDFGGCIDFRRSFITTSVNPFYDSFIRWQFNRLKDLGFLVFQKRLSIFSTVDNQPCADHERSQGEGVKPQEFTLIKMEVLHPYPNVLSPLESSSSNNQKKKIYLTPVTLRPETMYGQTNCWILPEGIYGAYEVSETEIFICTERAARNLAYQGHHGGTKVGTVRCLLDGILGQQLIGCALKAPNSEKYPTVYVLPMLSVSTKKGTGIVTSVPSDSPDDFTALMELKAKDKLREKFSVKDEWVLPFEPVPIISTPDFGDMAAKTVCEQMKIKSQNDAVNLQKAKEEVYTKGFYKGTLLLGKYKGQKVKDVKEKIEQEMIEANLAIRYAEPESLVVSRGGEECVVAYTDQWFLKYGEEKWRAQLESYVEKTLETFNPSTKKNLLGTIGWLKEWACSREYGMGTRLPFDERFVIESLSDSTIYMAYYTFAHLLQADGVLDGSKWSDNVNPTQMTPEVWNYILLGDPMPKDSSIDPSYLKQMRREFSYWYGVDLRTSGKDLIQNHLTMFLYNHVAIWGRGKEDEEKLWPKAIYANGHVMVNDAKMSKSAGNFLLMGETCRNYTADCTRIALADAGDTLDDANFVTKTADESILRLTTYLDWVEEMLGISSSMNNLEQGSLKLLRDDSGSTSSSVKTFSDEAFDNRMNFLIQKTLNAYKQMKFREALASGFFDYQIAKDDYILDSKKHGMLKRLVVKFIETQAIIMSPIIPHFSEHVWKLLGHGDSSICNARWPVVNDPDMSIVRCYSYLKVKLHMFRVKMEKDAASLKKKTGVEPVFDECTIYVVSRYSDDQLKVLDALRKHIQQKDTAAGGGGGFPEDLTKFIRGMFPAKDIKNEMMFAVDLQEQYLKFGEKALTDDPPFNEQKLWLENREAVENLIPHRSPLKVNIEVLDLKEEIVAKTQQPQQAKKTTSHQVHTNNVSVGNPTILFMQSSSNMTKK